VLATAALFGPWSIFLPEALRRRRGATQELDSRTPSDPMPNVVERPYGALAGDPAARARAADCPPWPGITGAIDPQEFLYAEVAREMVLRGEWLTLHLNGNRYLDKSPLFYWLIAIAYMVIGVSEFSARLPIALAGRGASLSGRRFIPRWRWHSRSAVDLLGHRTGRESLGGVESPMSCVPAIRADRPGRVKDAGKTLAKMITSR
jgi:hypothetical protein